MKLPPCHLSEPVPAVGAVVGGCGIGDGSASVFCGMLQMSSVTSTLVTVAVAGGSTADLGDVSVSVSLTSSSAELALAPSANTVTPPPVGPSLSPVNTLSLPVNL